MLNKRILVLMFLVLFLPLVGCLTPPNQTPIITSDPITTATVGVLYTYDVNATDPDDDALTYSLITKPSGMIINSASGLIKWTPVATQIGDNSVIVKVSDGSLSIGQRFTIKVSKPTPTPINHAPVIYSTPITTATVGITYFYNVNATDPDGDILTYFLTACPGGMTISSASGLIMWTPTVKGNYAVVVNVSDGVLSDAQSFLIVVDILPPVNHFPIITSTPGSTATVGVEYVYDVKAVDPDGDTLTYTLITKPGGMTIDLSTIRWTPTGGQVGVGNFTVKVSDGQLSATQSFGIIVKAAEPEPEPELTEIEISPEAITLVEGDSQQLTVTAIYSDGSNANITSDCIYASSNSDIASVGVYGLIMAMDFGEATIYVSATSNGIIFTDTVEVTVGPVYNVTQNFYRNTIQAAIDDSSTKDGDTIEVSAGTYDENVMIDVKGLTLKSVVKHEAIIKGIVVVDAEEVTLEGFIIRNAGWNAITLTTVAHNCVIVNNVGEYSLKDGLYVSFSDGNEIIDNEFKNNGQWGIFLSMCNGNIVKGNTLSDNAEAGLGFCMITDWTIEDNNFKDNKLHVYDQVGWLTLDEMIKILDDNIFPDEKAEVVGNNIQDVL